MSLAYYVGKFFNSNHFTLTLAVTLLIFSLLKYLKFPTVRRPKRLILGLILFGIVLRVLWLSYSSHTPQFSWNPKHMLENDLINLHAIDLTRGVWFVDDQGLPSGRRPIGYPLFLGLLYKVFGVHLWVSRVSNLALFAAAAVLIYQIARSIFSRRVGALAVFLYSIDPTSIYSVALITDEHLFLPVWYLGLWLLLRQTQGKAPRTALLWYGIIFGYATMIRTHPIFMPLVVAWCYGLMRKSLRETVSAFVVVLFVMQLVNLPWVLRNYRAWGQPVLYTATAGYLYSQFNSSASPEGGGHIPSKGEEGYSEKLEAAARSGNPAVFHSAANAEMMRWMRTHPKAALSLGVKRLIVFMGWNRSGLWPTWFQFYEGSYDPARPISSERKAFFEELAYAFYYSVLFSFIFSLFYFGRRWKTFPPAARVGILTLGACFFFWFLEHLVIYPDRKYRFPLEPLMIVSACVFFDHVIFRFRWKRLC